MCLSGSESPQAAQDQRNSAQPNRRRVRVKRKGLSVFLVLLGMALAAHSADNQPITPAQLTAWLMSGIPCNRLVRLIDERGVTSVPGKQQIRQLESAGADASL